LHQQFRLRLVPWNAKCKLPIYFGMIKGVFSFHFIQNFLDFGSLFCKIELNTMQNF
jgi:hypothetical protein